MRNRSIVLLSALVLILVMGMPATAGGPNDNGNGMHTIYVETQDAETIVSMPICQDGAEVGRFYFPSHRHTVLTESAKTDDSRIAWLAVSSNVAYDAAYRTDSRSHRFINSIGEDPNDQRVANEQRVITWSDPDGVYAESTSVYHSKFDSLGNYTSHEHDTGLVCLRDTLLP